MLRAFLTGSILYPAIEVAWRGRTHPAMALAGGLGLSALYRIHRAKKAALSGGRRCWAAF